MVTVGSISGDGEADSLGRSAKIFANKRVNILLGETNFLIWKQQVLLTVQSHRLEGFLTCYRKALAVVVRQLDGSEKANEEYENFLAQDIALSSWLLSTMSPHILSNFVGAESTAKIRSIVVEFFSSRSTTTVMSLHFKLWKIRKGDLSMQMYISKVKEICDALASCGSLVSKVEHIATILGGLPSEYKPFVAVVTASWEVISLDNVTTILVDAEAQ
ncbi:hypothetical protein HRI_003903600 [Hibiscus trionum]|uniref:Uncharacterized protein n=1 Tax=Hibiscus trionum TaxID=183268 RepID=A0A9W7IW21_HIBTR|nr:hypothetical protein HRI_003903600 [Hibiscus trionum]